MPNAMKISELGMLNDLRRLEIVSHNLANANTPGFKRDVGVTQGFEKHLDGELTLGAGFLPTTANQLVPQIERTVDFSPGVQHFTGNALDLALEGDAFFELTGAQGGLFCRSGSFTIDSSGRLSNAHGLIVSGQEGEILLGGGEIIIDREGKIYEDGEYVGQLKLVSFADTTGLIKGVEGLIAPKGMVAEPATNFGVRQGYQETSNVRVADEMLRMMETQRHFESTSRVIRGYDEMLSTAISTIAEL